MRFIKSRRDIITMEKMVSLTIDGIKAEVPEGTSVLKAAKDLGIMIPTLCYLIRLTLSVDAEYALLMRGQKAC